PVDLKRILKARSRTGAPPTAPAEGLYLLNVRY
ncbi:tRNA pseudouridine(38-40) synthase TruA, partial [bacterium]|nr:tRNA pseudouridine(38-40) synthase TruA [bacterium]